MEETTQGKEMNLVKETHKKALKKHTKHES